MGDPPNSIIEEPTSDDEMEYRRGVEHETEMDRILYGSPEIRPGSAISIDQQGQEPTSEDERVWRDRLEMEMVQERANISLDAENGESDERGDCAGDRSSSPFEEAQRPPWHGRLTLRGMTPSESTAESSEDESVRKGEGVNPIPSYRPDLTHTAVRLRWSRYQLHILVRRKASVFPHG